MTCPRCGASYDGKLICPRCVERMNAEAARRAQYLPLALVAQGQGEFVTHPTPTGEHAQMFGLQFNRRAFCGSEKRAARKNRRTARYRGDRWGSLCGSCRAAIEELLREALAAADQARAARAAGVSQTPAEILAQEKSEQKAKQKE